MIKPSPFDPNTSREIQTNIKTWDWKPGSYCCLLRTFTYLPNWAHYKVGWGHNLFRGTARRSSRGLAWIHRTAEGTYQSNQRYQPHPTSCDVVWECRLVTTTYGANCSKANFEYLVQTVLLKWHTSFVACLYLAVLPPILPRAPVAFSIRQPFWAPDIVCRGVYLLDYRRLAAYFVVRSGPCP